MKRKYSKPEIVFENFAMSTNIAAGCHFITKLPGEGTACGFKPSDRWTSDPIMVNYENGCGTNPPDEYDEVCYDGPVEGFDLFNS